MNYSAQIAKDGHLLNRPAKSGPKPKKPMPKKTKRRAKADREYTLRRRAYLLEHPWCEAHGKICAHLHANDMEAWHEAPCGSDGHGPAATEIHHTRKPKCKYLNDENSFLAVCEWSHDWIEDNKSTARLLGLLQY